MVSVLLGTFLRKHLNKSAILILGLAIILILSSMFCSVFFKLALHTLLLVLLLLSELLLLLGGSDSGGVLAWAVLTGDALSKFVLDLALDRTWDAEGDCVRVCSCKGTKLAMRLVGEASGLTGGVLFFEL